MDVNAYSLLHLISGCNLEGIFGYLLLLPALTVPARCKFHNGVLLSSSSSFARISIKRQDAVCQEADCSSERKRQPTTTVNCLYCLKRIHNIIFKAVVLIPEPIVIQISVFILIWNPVIIQISIFKLLLRASAQTSLKSLLESLLKINASPNADAKYHKCN